jgi:hypothetical protein
MIRVLMGDGYWATIKVPWWVRNHCRRIYRNGRKAGAAPIIARFAVGQFIADNIGGNVPWKPWLP